MSAAGRRAAGEEIGSHQRIGRICEAIRARAFFDIFLMP